MKKILLYSIGCVVIVLCVVCYFAFTQTRELQECKNEQDKISGCVQKKYYENGNLEIETPFENGKLHGVEKWYYENGNLECEIPYQNGKLHGVEKEYDENGILMSEIPYQNGKLHGVGKVYYENGNLQAQVTYENGSVLSGVCGDGKEIPNIQGLGYWNIGKQISETCKE